MHQSHRISKLTLWSLRLVIIIVAIFFQHHSFSREQKGSNHEITREVKDITEWVLDSENNQQLPFVVIDKKAAMVFVFTSIGALIGSSPALLGITLGDVNIAGVGKKKNSEILLHEKITPAGRFIADLGYDLNKSNLLWIDYDSGFSMHPVVTANARERRLQRLLSNDSTQRRITYGCVNISSQFYYSVIQKIFKNTSGIVYVLPEIYSIQKVFGLEAARFIGVKDKQNQSKN